MQWLYSYIVWSLSQLVNNYNNPFTHLKNLYGI